MFIIIFIPYLFDIFPHSFRADGLRKSPHPFFDAPLPFPFWARCPPAPSGAPLARPDAPSLYAL